MPFNFDDTYFKKNEKVQEIAFHSSSVIELLSICHSFSDDQHKFGKEAYFSYLEDFLDEKDKETIYNIHRLPFYGLQIMLLALKTKQFDDIEAFLSEVEHMPEEDFIHIMSGEIISKEEIESIRESAESISRFAKSNKWVSDMRACTFEKLVSNPGEFKKSFVKLFHKLSNERFREQLAEFREDYANSRRYLDVFLVNNQPMDILNDFKGFDKTQHFEEIIMAPAIMLEPHRTYLYHDSKRLLVLYDTELLRDYTNLQLEKSSDFLKTIADFPKMNMLSLLRYNKLCAAELSKLLNLTTATISRHIDSLMRFGLIIEEKQRNTKYYALNSKTMLKEFEDIIELLALDQANDKLVD